MEMIHDFLSDYSYVRLTSFFSHGWVCLIEGKIWVNFITTEPCSPEPWNHGLVHGKSSPFMAELFRLVKYYNLHRLNGHGQPVGAI